MAGLPLIATSAAAEGMALRHRVEYLQADRAESFADAVVELYDDHEAWERLRASGTHRVRKDLGVAAMAAALERMLTGSSTAPVPAPWTAPRAANDARSAGAASAEGPASPVGDEVEHPAA